MSSDTKLPEVLSPEPRDEDTALPGAACPLPIFEHKQIVIGHGSGGKLTAQLIERIFLPAFTNPLLDKLDDQAVIQFNGSRLAFTTDAFVVTPIFFPGGDIGHLAVNGDEIPLIALKKRQNVTSVPSSAAPRDRVDLRGHIQVVLCPVILHRTTSAAESDMIPICLQARAHFIGRRDHFRKSRKMSNPIGRTFQQIWKQMDHERRRQVATAFFTSSETADERRTVAGLIAKKLNLRPQKAAKLPADKAAAYLSGIESIDEPLAAMLVRTYLFAHQQPMLVTFLDELHIPHENGVIPDDNVAAPDADALRAATNRIRTTFPAEDVQLYLSALLASDAVTWASLGTALADEQT